MEALSWARIGLLSFEVLVGWPTGPLASSWTVTARVVVEFACRTGTQAKSVLPRTGHTQSSETWCRTRYLADQDFTDGRGRRHRWGLPKHYMTVTGGSA